MPAYKYTDAQKAEALKLYQQLGVPAKDVEKRTGVKANTVGILAYLNRKESKGVLKESNYPIFDSPITLEGDAVVYPDIETPYHHAEFVNRVTDLAQAWQIEQAIFVGDLVHFDCFSGWEAGWIAQQQGGITESAERKLMDKITSMRISANNKNELMTTVVEIGGIDEELGLTPELNAVRKTLKVFEEVYKVNAWVMGNHEGRVLRTFNLPVVPDELLKWLAEKKDKWLIAPYYYAILETEKGTYRLSHPKNTAKYAHVKGADKYDCHFAMGHSHYWTKGRSTSGKHWAMQIGHCVDEQRLAYVAQRDSMRDMHVLGALIIKDGYPYLLSPETDWERMKKLWAK